MGLATPSSRAQPTFRRRDLIVGQEFACRRSSWKGWCLVRNTGCKVTPTTWLKGCSFFGHMRAYSVLDPELHRRVSSTPSRSTPHGRPSAAIFLVIYRPLACGSFTYRFERLSFSLCWWHTRVSQRFAVSQCSCPPPPRFTRGQSILHCNFRVHRELKGITTSFSLGAKVGLIVED